MKKLLALLLSVTLAASFLGCAREEEQAPEATAPTVPTLSGEETPLQLLTAAAEKTKGASAFCLDYTLTNETGSYQLQTEQDGSFQALGSRVCDGQEQLLWYQDTVCYEKTGEDVTRREQETAFRAAQVPEQLDFLRQRQGLLEAFCDFPLSISPSRDGSFRYLVSGLDWEAFSKLLYGAVTEAPEQAPPPEGYWAALTIDPEGFLSTLEFAQQATVTLSQINEPLNLTQPDWVP